MVIRWSKIRRVRPNITSFDSRVSPNESHHNWFYSNTVGSNQLTVLGFGFRSRLGFSDSNLDITDEALFSHTQTTGRHITYLLLWMKKQTFISYNSFSPQKWFVLWQSKLTKVCKFAHATPASRTYIGKTSISVMYRVKVHMEAQLILSDVHLREKKKFPRDAQLSSRLREEIDVCFYMWSRFLSREGHYQHFLSLPS